MTPRLLPSSTIVAVALSVLIAPCILLIADSGNVSADMASQDTSGRAIFERECAVCHGSAGDGRGPAAKLLDPPPRSFIEGLYKLRSTESGELPTDDDLFKTVSDGIAGSGMPSFRHLGGDSIRSAVNYLKTLGGPPNENGSWFDVYEVPPPITIPPAPQQSAEQSALGAKLYTDMGCDGCHGAGGRGDGKKPEELLDHSGRPMHARNFHLGLYKGGARPSDIYTRIMTGMDGTPMTGFWKDAMTPDERWAVVQYIVSFGEPRAVEQPSNGTISVAAVGSLPAATATPSSEASTNTDSDSVLRMALRGGWIRYFEPLDVRAVAAGDKLSVSVSWDDGAADCRALELWFPVGDRRAPTFHVGSPDLPLRIWRWQEDASRDVSSVAEPAPTPSLGVSSVDAEVTADVKRSGDRIRVTLNGAAPTTALQILVTVDGCIDGADYRTASTFYDLQRDADADTKTDVNAGANVDRDAARSNPP